MTPLDHARVSTASAATALQRGSFCEQLIPPALAQSRPLWGKKPLSGVVRGAAVGHAR